MKKVVYQITRKRYELVDNSKTGEDLYFEKLEKELFSERLHLAINSLTPRQKEMVIMIYFENKTQIEVASYYGISKAAVSRAVDRIRNTLRKKLYLDR